MSTTSAVQPDVRESRARTAEDTARPGGPLSAIRDLIRKATLRSEAEAVLDLRNALTPLEASLACAKTRAARWVNAARGAKRSRPIAESLMEQFPLDSPQGRSLMSLAEALLRTPDRTRADQLIAERLASLRSSGVTGADDWLLKAGFVLLSTAGRLLPDVGAELSGQFSAESLAKPFVAPVVRRALRGAMEMLGEAFIVGETIDAALARGKSDRGLALCSFDVLGEGARTVTDAQRYLKSYSAAIDVLGHQPPGSVHQRSSISVKLSALEPRYSLLQRDRVCRELVPRMIELARRAARAGIGMTLDAEEADRLDISLDVVEALARDATTRSWDGLGLAIQAYGRRAPWVIDWTAELARECGRRMTVRLVKGAYWDSEIKRAQERGLDSFPVFTSKAATDACYLACVGKLFGAVNVLHPQFATHNAFTIAAVLELAPPGAHFEFQRLHGMGEVVFDAARAEVPDLPPVRAYAPVGTHEDLLPYLVRRLLENGANTSFVHQFLNTRVPVEEVVSDPLSRLSTPSPSPPVAGSAAATPTPVAGSAAATPLSPRPEAIREPGALFAPERANSSGLDWGDPAELTTLTRELADLREQVHRGGPLLLSPSSIESDVPVVSPADSRETVGYSRDATADEITRAMDTCARAQHEWDALGANERAACLERAADLLEQRRPVFVSLLVRPSVVGPVVGGVEGAHVVDGRGVQILDRADAGARDRGGSCRWPAARRGRTAGRRARPAPAGAAPPSPRRARS